MATYIGVGLYIILYGGYTLYEKFIMKKSLHFVPLAEVDFVTDAVWQPGEGDAVRERDRAIDQERKEALLVRGAKGRGRALWDRITEYVY